MLDPSLKERLGIPPEWLVAELIAWILAFGWLGISVARLSVRIATLPRKRRDLLRARDSSEIR
jgi:hypothetical protein